jgi:prepilin-type N-terminal cleavage/methylation domain-containing protein
MLQIRQMTKRHSGFTLIELMLAVAIAVVILMAAVPIIGGMSSERRLTETFERFDALTRKAQFNAVREQRPWVLVWEKGRILLQPDEPTPEERASGAAEGGAEFVFEEEEAIGLTRPAALLPAKDVPADWTFWRSGTCEPVLVKYSGPAGWWTAQYNPLTGRGEITEQGTN